MESLKNLRFWKKLDSISLFQLIGRSFNTDNYFEEWNEITPQTHIRKFEERAAWGWGPAWGSFLISIGSSGLVQTLCMSEMTPSKAHVLKPFILQIFWCDFGEWFLSLLERTRPVTIFKQARNPYVTQQEQYQKSSQTLSFMNQTNYAMSV